MKDFSHIYNAHPSYIDHLYKSFQKDPGSLDISWAEFFKGFDFAQSFASNASTTATVNENITKEFNAFKLIHAYRSRAHLLSDTNPIRKRRDRKPMLSPKDFGFTDQDLDNRFTAGFEIGLQNSKLTDIIQKLNQIYCSKIGFEYFHLEDLEKREWLKQKIESRNLNADFGLSLKIKERILDKLNGAVIFEKFLNTKYVGQKRFSLEGGESIIPALDIMINESSKLGVEEVILGMAHRGRLNVLVNIIGKTYEQLFSEFEGTAVPDLSFGSGDVKYHLGFSSQVKTLDDKLMHLKLAPNPSHLEAVDPVVLGLARAKADLLYNSDYDKILPILIHGDSAIAGQGIVYEIIQMSKLEGYYTGGTIHFIINNQIGFTTDFEDARSSTYCTSIANTIQAPVFHVNGDDPEAVLFAAALATEYRQHFNSDVFIDMVCYRRHGHNEGDDPKFTQPEMYAIINQHPNVRELYIKTLEHRGDVQEQVAHQKEKEFWNHLQERLNLAKENSLPYHYQEPELEWKSLKKFTLDADFESSPETGISATEIWNLLNKLISLPQGFSPLPKIKRLLKNWEELIQSKKLDWSLAELLAYSSILSENKNVRMSGQDVKRGTFSHRHAILFEEKTNIPYNRLSNLKERQGKFLIYNSLLSEFGVLGFEFGYSLASPNHLVIWEAQFGDFSNGAQVIIDQFITTSQSKWNRMSGLVLLLPHGYDGQGPEHSSARLERFLQAAAERNITIANVTTPSNFFHLLRRQLSRNFRTPLIVMSPKSLLRHPNCISEISEFEPGTSFHELIVDNTKARNLITELLFCSGQIYYQLKQKAVELKNNTKLIVRLEQLYPLPVTQINKLLRDFPNAKIRWIQEEPLNMGAASYIKLNWAWSSIEIIARPASAAPAAGHKSIHDEQLHTILNEVFN